jgi:hypothetical protein
MEKCLHLESDVLLGSNFPFHKFENLSKFSWSRFNSGHDVAAIFYVPNPSSAKLFDDKFMEILVENPNLTDMTGLSKIGHACPDIVEYLPSAESDESDLFNDRNVSKIDRELMSRNFDYFGGIFDAAPIGMWTLGQDPRNHRGMLKRNVSLPESFINPGEVDYEVTLDSRLIARRKSNNTQEIRLFSLHVHSKNERFFRLNSVETLRSYFRTSAANKQLVSFYLNVFLQCMLKGAKRRFLRFVRGLNI